MLRASADVRRVRITGPRDLNRVPDTGSWEVDPWTISQANGMYERLCRSLGAHLDAAVDGVPPRPGDEDPSMLKRVLADIRHSGCELWAVTVTFRDAVQESLKGSAERTRQAVQVMPRTRFLVLPAPPPAL